MWIDNKVHQDFFPRLEMIDDLKSQYLKIGVKRSEIIKILGKPDLVINPFHLSYQLGPMGMAGSTGYLHIIFDKDQKLYLYDVQ